MLIFIVVKLRGFSNLTLFALRYLKISHIDDDMKKLDDEWFDFQLFKVKHSVNVCTLKDARVIQQALVDGDLKSSCFSFTGSWGDITKVTTFKTMYPTALLVCSFILLGMMAWLLQCKF